MTKRIASVAITAGLACLGDVQYEETSRVTGGSMTRMPIVGGRLKEPTTSTHYLKGNKMSMVSKSKDSTTQIIYDLDKETVTQVDQGKKQYSVMTFAEMREAMEKAMEQMRQMNPAAAQQKGEMDVNVNVQDGNEDKQIQGLSAHKWILDVDTTAKDAKSGQVAGTRMHTEMWMSPEFPGGQEMIDFHKRMAVKMGYGALTSLNPMVRAQMGKGFEKYAQEMSKMKGHPVLTTMRMGSVLDGKEVMIPESQANAPAVDVKGAATDAAAESATSAAASRVGGRLGGLASTGIGGLGGLRRKKREEQQQQQQTAAAATPESGGGAMVPQSLMEVTTELTSVSKGAVDGSMLSVPGDYKEVESPMKKMLNRK